MYSIISPVFFLIKSSFPVSLIVFENNIEKKGDSSGVYLWPKNENNVTYSAMRLLVV